MGSSSGLILQPFKSLLYIFILCIARYFSTAICSFLHILFKYLETDVSMAKQMGFMSVVFSGIIDPIKSDMRDPKLGLGKQEEDNYFTAEENIQRRKLDIEVEETEENAKKREVCLLILVSVSASIIRRY